MHQIIRKSLPGVILSGALFLFSLYVAQFGVGYFFIAAAFSVGLTWWFDKWWKRHLADNSSDTG